MSWVTSQQAVSKFTRNSAAAAPDCNTDINTPAPTPKALGAEILLFCLFSSGALQRTSSRCPYSPETRDPSFTRTKALLGGGEQSSAFL